MTAAAADLEELLLGELPRLNRVRDEHGLEMRVLPPRRPCTTQKKNVFASLRSFSVMLDDTSIAKYTTASVAGRRRESELPVAQVVVRERRSLVLHRPALQGASFSERRRSSRERTPRRLHPSRV